jgi:hypothetical protein
MRFNLELPGNLVKTYNRLNKSKIKNGALLLLKFIRALNFANHVLITKFGEIIHDGWSSIVVTFKNSYR